jgi:hypothetical protein
MAATPFKGTVSFRYNDGEVDIQPFTASDITAKDVVFAASSLTFYATRKNGVLADIALSAAGVDTSQLKLIVNNKDTGIALLGSGLVATVNNRMPVPIPIAANAQVQIHQLT